MAHVAREVVQPRQASLIPESVHRLRSAAGLNPRRAHGIRGLETTTSRFFCSHRQVQPELLCQVSVAPAWKQRSPETVNPFAKEAHAIVRRPHSIRRANGLSSGALDCQMRPRRAEEGMAHTREEDGETQ